MTEQPRSRFLAALARLARAVQRAQNTTRSDYALAPDHPGATMTDAAPDAPGLTPEALARMLAATDVIAGRTTRRWDDLDEGTRARHLVVARRLLSRHAANSAVGSWPPIAPEQEAAFTELVQLGRQITGDEGPSAATPPGCQPQDCCGDPTAHQPTDDGALREQDQAYYHSRTWQENEQAAVAELKRGEGRHFASAKAATRWLLSSEETPPQPADDDALRRELAKALEECRTLTPEAQADAVLPVARHAIAAWHNAYDRAATAEAAVARVRALANEYANSDPRWRPLARATAEVLHTTLDQPDTGDQQ